MTFEQKNEKNYECTFNNIHVWLGEDPGPSRSGPQKI